MKKIGKVLVVFLCSIVILLVGLLAFIKHNINVYHEEEKNLSKRIGTVSAFDANTMKNGDKIGDWIVKEVRYDKDVDMYLITFDNVEMMGNILIDTRFNTGNPEYHKDFYSFEPDKSSYAKVPNIKNYNCYSRNLVFDINYIENMALRVPKSWLFAWYSRQDIDKVGTVFPFGEAFIRKKHVKLLLNDVTFLYGKDDKVTYLLYGAKIAKITPLEK